MSLSAGRVGVRADQVDSHGRVISPSFLNEIIEDLPEWTNLPVRVNGTEELIPSNPSVPVTSPILADIDYPDVRRNNQYFTYRESPTSVDGLAKIKSIKGNTLVFNQLVQNGNFADISSWNAVSGTTYTVSNNEGHILSSASGVIFFSQNIAIPQNHVILMTAFIKASKNVGSYFSAGSAENFAFFSLTTGWQECSVIARKTSTNKAINFVRISSGLEAGDSVDIKNAMIVDLTQMFGAGNEPTTVEEFTALFPLPYYAYDSGSLLSFNGSGIKTTNADGTEESTTSLPTLTYFPTGMKSAGTVYDELTPTKAITRIGAVDLGSLTWTYNSTYQAFYTTGIKDLAKRPQPNEVPNMTSIYTPRIMNSFTNPVSDMSLYYNTLGDLWIRNMAYTDTTTFKSAMSGVYLYYELATPVELPTLDFGE